ncbi:MAG: uroporphyrinogen-III synthase, partial [Armatimonadota bacterium]|nr:uroporphyrinogen-III synthase [Armatimonadota bacterium]
MTLPLQGKRVLVTRPKGQEEELVQKLRAVGAEPVVLPVISILPPEDWKQVDTAIRQLETFHWVVFTSVNGVRSFIGRMEEMGVPMSVLAGRRLAAIGPATAAALESLCRAPDIVPEQYLSEAVPDALGNVEGSRVLLPRADIARKEMAIELRRRGAEVVEVTVYRVQQHTEEVETRLASLPKPDYITLTSPSTVRSLARMLQETGRSEWLTNVPLVCIGPVTAEAVRALGYQPACVAEEHTVEGLV